MLTEQDIIDRYRQSLNTAVDVCKFLESQKSTDHWRPRGLRYMALRTAVEELEGCCRQLSQYREDTRWLEMGVGYAKVLQIVQHAHVGEHWDAFGELTTWFKDRAVSMHTLLTQKTERRGAILPQNPASWIQIPEWKMPQRAARLRN